MHISRVLINNFRLLKNSSLDLRNDLSLIIGKNNTGKTSLFVLFEKFLYQPGSFHYNDFSLSLRGEILNINKDTAVDSMSIKMILEVSYDEDDNLETLSEFILDLEPDARTVKILFECSINKDTLLKDIEDAKEDKEKLIIKLLGKHLITKVYVFDDSNELNLERFFKENRHELIEKQLKDLKHLINLQIIHARREVASSNDSNSKKPLSAITTNYFNSEHDLSNEDLIKINDLILNMDKELGKRYDSFFKDFLENSKTFLSLGNLSVISNIQSNMLFDNSSEVIYGSENNHLPEHFNGLGYMNILYLLLSIEIKKNEFKKSNNDINLLFIEEPEAHTHPQMQYVFANEIKTILKEVDNLQTIVSSHSSHIVSQSDFEDIRYLKLVADENIEIKNFHTELKQKYSSEPEHFKFLKQYLNIQSAELFFASKVIFIEGITERMLLPYFIKNFDLENRAEDYTPLASQNISVLEVGANAKIFAPFLEFLDIKTLVITDIDTTDKNNSGKASPVSLSNSTSNATLRFFFDSPADIQSTEFDGWFNNLRNHLLVCKSSNVKVMYQTEEEGNQARSFEEAFISINIEALIGYKDLVEGLKNKDQLETNNNYYELSKNIVDKKSDFAASILYLVLANEDLEWKIPAYIKDGLSWVQSNDSV